MKKKIETRDGSQRRSWALDAGAKPAPTRRFEVAVRKDRIFWIVFRRSYWAQLITRCATSELVDSVGPFSSRRDARVFGWEWEREQPEALALVGRSNLVPRLGTKGLA